MADLGRVRARDAKREATGLGRVLRILRVVLLALLFAFLVGFVIGTLLRERLDEPIHYYGRIDSRCSDGAPT